MENKINIEAKGEKLLLGNDIIELRDLSKETFTTDNPEDLKNFIEDTGRNTTCFISGLNIEVYYHDDTDYNTKPAATCKLEKHPVVDLLKFNNGKSVNLPEFSMLLERLKKYMTTDALAFKDNIADLKIKKILSLENKNDRRGNYSFTVKAESGGKDDYEFPKSIKLNIPLLKSLPGTATEFTFDFYFSWKAEEQNIDLKFCIENFEFNQVVDDEIKNLLDGILVSENITIYHGSLTIHRQTDQWKYLVNELKIKEH